MPKNDIPIHNFHDSMDQFTDRKEIIATCKRLFQTARIGKFSLLSIRGMSGMGRATLLDHVTNTILPPQWHAERIMLDYDVPDLAATLLLLERVWRPCVSLDAWNVFLHKFQASQKQFARAVHSGNTFYQIQYLEGNSENNSQDLRVDLRSNEVRLALLEDLRKATLELVSHMERPLCIFIQNFEYFNKMNERLGEILCQGLFNECARHAAQPLVVITVGTQGLSYHAGYEHAELENFSPEDVKEYLEKHHIPTDTSFVNAFMELTTGYPLALMFAANLFLSFKTQERTISNLLSPSTRSRIYSEVLKYLQNQLLQHQTHPFDELLRWSPLLRVFDKDALQVLYKTLHEEGDSSLTNKQYEYFIQQPFIATVGKPGERATQGLRALHEMVRRAGLENLHDRQEEVQRGHAALAAHYKARMKGNNNDFSPQFVATLSEQEFRIFVQYFDHAFQVKDLQEAAFHQWERLLSSAIQEWHYSFAALLLEAVEQLEKDDETILGKDFISRFWFWKARFLEQFAQWPKARHFLGQTVQHWRQAEDLKLLARSLHEIGLTHCYEDNVQEAFPYFEEAYETRKKVGDLKSAAISLNNIAYIHRRQNKLEEALQCCKQALELLRKEDTIYKIYLFENLASLYQAQQNWSEALYYYHLALDLKPEEGNDVARAQSYAAIGSLYQEQNRWQEAHAAYAQALIYYRNEHCHFRREREDTLKKLAWCYAAELETLAKCYDASGDHTRSLAYQNKAQLMRQEIE